MRNTLIYCNGQKIKKIKTKSHNSVSERAVLLSDIQDMNVSGFKPRQSQLFIVLTGVMTVWVLVANCQTTTMTCFILPFQLIILQKCMSISMSVQDHIVVHLEPYRQNNTLNPLYDCILSWRWMFVCVAPHFQEGELESDLKLLMTKALHGQPCFLLQHQGVGKCAYKLRQQQCPKCTQS